MNVDDGLEDIGWIRGLGGERLPPASYPLLPNLKKNLFFAIGEGSRIVVVCFLHTSGQTFLYQTPGRRPPRITVYISGRGVNTVTMGWVGAPNLNPVQNSSHSRWFCRPMSVQDSESSRFESNIWLSFSQADLGPTSGQEIFFTFLRFFLVLFL